MIWGFSNIVPPILGSLALAGILAAGLSSASPFLSVVGFSITNDILSLKFKDDRDKLVKTRFIMLGVSVVALIIAFGFTEGIRNLSWLASTLIASSWCFVAFASVWWKRFTARGASFAMVAGFFGYVIPAFLKKIPGWVTANMDEAAAAAWN